MGFDAKMGARPLHRTIDDQIKKPLSKEILFGSLVNGGIVKVGADGDQFTFEYVNSGDLLDSGEKEKVDESSQD